MTDPIDVIDGMDGLCYRLQEIIICNIFFCGAAIGDLAIICGVFRRFPAFSGVFRRFSARGVSFSGRLNNRAKMGGLAPFPP